MSPFSTALVRAAFVVKSGTSAGGFGTLGSGRAGASVRNLGGPFSIFSDVSRESMDILSLRRLEKAWLWMMLWRLLDVSSVRERYTGLTGEGMKKCTIVSVVDASFPSQRCEVSRLPAVKLAVFANSCQKSMLSKVLADACDSWQREICMMWT